ncbi:MAG: alpha/beta hydrolase [Alphaproteobacteria bacterium]|nr:MAG: alpha/beta hydrolase [Alphaproteobacteria bacterium]
MARVLFSPLALFDALVPKDRVSRLVAKDQSFAEGPRGRLDVYAPRKKETGRPVAVFFYGGSWQSGRKDDYRFAGRALAAQGFVTFIPDYRLHPHAPYPGFLEDCAAAVRWVRANAERFGGDPDRIVLLGHSAGAYNAAMLALDPRWLGEEGAAVKGLAGLAGPYDFLPLDSTVTKAVFGDVEDLPSTQPTSFAGPGAPPAFLAHGVEDTTVRPVQSARLARKLRDAGVKVEAPVYPGIGHVAVLSALARPLRGKAPVLRDLADFIHRVTER